MKIDIKSNDDNYYYVKGIKDSTLIVSQPIINGKDNLKVTPIVQ